MTLAIKTLLPISILFALAFPASASENPDAEKLFKQKCALCHAIDKKKLGPAVSAMSRDSDALRQTITQGKNAMPAYEGKLAGTEIAALVDYLLANQQINIE